MDCVVKPIRGEIQSNKFCAGFDEQSMLKKYLLDVHCFGSPIIVCWKFTIPALGRYLYALFFLYREAIASCFVIYFDINILRCVFELY